MEGQKTSKDIIPTYQQASSSSSPVQQQPVSIKLKQSTKEEQLPTQNCPPGLECLSELEKIMIHQKVQLLEVCLCIEKNNKYVLTNSLGEKIYKATENNCFCTRMILGYCRPFTIKICDLTNQEVITLERPLRCNWLCSHGCLQEIKICTPSGILIGYVSQKRHAFLRKFTIQDEERKDILRIVGPFFWCTCWRDIEYKIKSLDEKIVVGNISKLFSGLIKGLCTDYSNYAIQFPSGLDVKMKALVIGACFLIDFMFYERCAIFKLCINRILIS
ncbi:phospholipid scramblase 2-like [Erinaceus europaeus]|uniref:Phospholipid scramblase n=1 Tax=Erinaceus europaeus TaxID=9365 RepID=A0A1S2ZEF9_ERIEU|nr:phospholipid scramblase 2-like [Erinaceus europaeus]